MRAPEMFACFGRVLAHDWEDGHSRTTHTACPDRLRFQARGSAELEGCHLACLWSLCGHIFTSKRQVVRRPHETTRRIVVAATGPGRCQISETACLVSQACRCQPLQWVRFWNKPAPTACFIKLVIIKGISSRATFPSPGVPRRRRPPRSCSASGRLSPTTPVVTFRRRQLAIPGPTPDSIDRTTQYPGTPVMFSLGLRTP